MRQLAGDIPIVIWDCDGEHCERCRLFECRIESEGVALKIFRRIAKDAGDLYTSFLPLLAEAAQAHFPRIGK
jgi:hypothetical protein